MIYGYARVSTTEQNLDRQLEALTKLGCERIFADKKSGKDFDRKEYQKLKRKLKSGDVLYIKSIDRLGRDYDMIMEDIVVVDMPLLDTRDKDKGLTGKFISDLVLQILSYVAETERQNIKQRQAEGIRIAKAKGVHMGRPFNKLPSNFFEVAQDFEARKITLEEALRQTQMAKATFYKKYKENGYGKRSNQKQKAC